MEYVGKNSRRTAQERRDDGSKDVAHSIDRRKRPDRRLSGVDVCVVDVTETAFLNFIDQFGVKN